MVRLRDGGEFADLKEFDAGKCFRRREMKLLGLSEDIGRTGEG